jgi:leader peptidase (prepilin peptidase)/N-methyltransferase
VARAAAILCAPARSAVTLIALLLWGVLGVLGGALAYRLAVGILAGYEEPPAPGWPPSCAGCGRSEPPTRWIALLTFLPPFRCPACGRIGERPQMIVEAATAGLFVALRARIEDDRQVGLYALSTLVLIAVTVTDFRARLIPNAISYPATALALVVAAVPGLGFPSAAPDADWVGLGSASLGGLAAGGLALAMYLGGMLLYRRDDVFGLGDVKLAFFIGVVTGFPRALSAFVAGVLIGAVMGLAILAVVRSRRATMAYGPALAAGAYLTFLAGAP